MRQLICILIPALVGTYAIAQGAGVDNGRSNLTIHVDKTGLFSAFAHNHTIQAPIASGRLDVEKRSITLTFNSSDIKVMDPDVKDSERAEIDQTMKSEKVLDARRFPEIRFVSTTIAPQQGDRYQVRGDLTLHGVTKPVEITVTSANGRYNGSVRLKQTEYGITPVSVAGGTVKVKDVIEIVFEIVPGS